MRTYVAITGILFALLAAAHVARIFLENRALASDPVYIGITALAVALAVWAWAVFRRAGKP